MCLGRTFVFPVFLVVAAQLGAADVDDSFLLPRDSALRALAERALERNPEILAAASSARAQRERIAQATALPDPVATVGYENGGRGLAPGADDDTGLLVTMSQALPGPGKRRLAGAVESRQADAAASGLRRAQLKVLYRLRGAYSDLLLAREKLKILDEEEAATRSIEAAARSRYSVGVGGIADVLRARAELARLDRSRTSAREAEAVSLSEIRRVCVFGPGAPVSTETTLRDLAGLVLAAPKASELEGRLDDAVPEIRAGAALLDSARAAADLARRSAHPDFMVAASYLNRGSLPPMTSLELGITLPVYRGHKQQRAVAEAMARVQVAQAALDAVRLSAQTAVEEGVQRLSSAIEQASALGRVLKVDALAVEAALASYRTGQVPFVAVLDAHTTLFHDRSDQAEVLAAALRSSASLDAWLVDD